MPSWFKKHFKLLRLEVSEHLWLVKNKNRLSDRHGKNGDNNACDKSPVIRNDLRSNRRHNKDDMNAYRDYSKRCEEVLFYQNNCALRCAQGQAAKPLNNENKNDNNNVNKTDNAGQSACVKSVKNVCDNATSTECCDRNCEFYKLILCTWARKTFLIMFATSIIIRLLLLVLRERERDERKKWNPK